MSEAMTPDARLRELGWSVAIHNDYRQAGEPHTFWLWTHPDGRWIKGEGRTDAEALAECLAAREALAARSVPEGWKLIIFVIQIEADNSERYAIFSTMEMAKAWAEKTPDFTHIFADLMVDLPEWGNEALEQRQ